MVEEFMDLDLTNCDENDFATRRFGEWCLQLGFDGRLVNDDRVFLLRSRFKWNCEIKANARTNHRIVLTTMYGSKKSGAASKDEWLDLVNRINVQQNLFKFAFDNDRDMLVQVHLVFLEKISPRLLRNFVNSIDEYFASLLIKHKEFFESELE